MSHGKETPRQKMIGMMYLVLTAMLAMNVSADLLNAFALVDSGLSQTTRNYATKNQETFGLFESAEQLNPNKVRPWRESAQRVHEASQRLYAHIGELKREIVRQADGEDSPALQGVDVNGEALDSKANTDVPGTILIMQGKGRALKDTLVAYRNLLLSLLDKEHDAQLYASVEAMLATNPPSPTEDGIQHTWESYRFEHIPLIAVLPQLTKVQVDVLNAEADVMAYLLNKIDAGDFKFNKIGAVVMANSDYIVRGGEFRAEVFMAASDTTQRPTVYIGRYDSVRNDVSGEWEYRPLSEKDTIPVNMSGRGVMRRPASSVGAVNWGGLIEVTGPDGSKVRRPFRHRYTVVEPSFAVSPTKMNVLYLGVQNPVEISVSGVSMENVQVSMKGGTISKSGSSFVAVPVKGSSQCEVVVAVRDGSSMRQMGSKKFRVKKVPDPVPTFSGIDAKATTVDKAQLLNTLGVVAKMPEDFDFDMKFKVRGFKVGSSIGGVPVEKEVLGANLSAEQKKLLTSVRPGQIVTLSEIMVLGDDGVLRTLPGRVYKVR